MDEGWMRREDEEEEEEEQEDPFMRWKIIVILLPLVALPPHPAVIRLVFENEYKPSASKEPLSTKTLKQGAAVCRRTPMH